MKLAGRAVKMFRCHIDPMIGPHPRNAFVTETMKFKKCVINDEATGVYVLTDNGREHFVAFTNVQSNELYPLPETVTKKAKE